MQVALCKSFYFHFDGGTILFNWRKRFYFLPVLKSFWNVYDTSQDASPRTKFKDNQERIIPYNLYVLHRIWLFMGFSHLDVAIIRFWTFFENLWVRFLIEHICYTYIVVGSKYAYEICVSELINKPPIVERFKKISYQTFGFILVVHLSYIFCPLKRVT